MRVRGCGKSWGHSDARPSKLLLLRAMMSLTKIIALIGLQEVIPEPISQELSHEHNPAS